MSDKNKKALTDNPLFKAVGTQKLVVLLTVIVLAAFFCIVSPSFRQYSTLVSIFDYSYYISFMAIGVTFALITGGVDLSIGTGMVCCALVGGYAISNLNMPVIVGILLALAVGLLFGVFNGFLVAVLNLPPFIATLGAMMIARGIGSILTGGVSTTWPQVGTEQGWFRSLFKFKLGDTMIPIGFLIVIAMVILMSVFLNKTRPGRYIIAIGSNKEATRLSGVNVVKWQFLAYIISGTFMGIAGVAYAATFQTIAPGTGAGLELDAIAGAIIGGTSMSGGSGTIVGTLLGVFIMSLLKSGLPYIGLQANWQQIITGMVLILAVLLDVWKKRRIK